MEQQQIYVGLVGFGLSGKYFHAPFLISDRRFHLKKVVERSKEESKKLSPDIEVVTSIDELLEDNLLDLIVIATPNNLHYEMTKKSLLAEKHVIVEKPFTVNSSEAIELIKLAKKKKRILSVYHNRRWDGDFLTVQEVISKEWLGQLVEFESQFSKFNPGKRRAEWREHDNPGSGLLYDLGPHLIDQAVILFGKPRFITADIRKQRDYGEADDYFDLWFYYNSVKVRVKAGLLMREPEPRFSLHGIKGSFVKYGVDPQEAFLKHGKMPHDPDFGVEEKGLWGKINAEIDGVPVERSIETLQGNYAGFYDNIYNAIVKEEPLQIKPKEAMLVVQIIEKAFDSNRLKRAVRLD